MQIGSTPAAHNAVPAPKAPEPAKTAGADSDDDSDGSAPVKSALPNGAGSRVDVSA